MSVARFRSIRAGVAATLLPSALLLAMPPGPVTAQVTFQTFTEGFEDGGNAGGWTWFLADQPFLAPTGGNPDAYLTANQWTSPGAHIRTTKSGSPFTGDLRAAHVVSFGVDFKSFVLQEDIGSPLFDAFRFTIALGNDGGTPLNYFDDTAYFFKTDAFLPLVGEGWLSHDVAVPTGAADVPPGWKLVEFSSAGPPEDPLRWDQVMSDVSYAWLMYADPNGFYIIANWLLGADNVRVTTASGSAFTDLGLGLAGTHGVPLLAGAGTLLALDPLSLTLSGALEQTTAWLVVGFEQIDAPFKGGTLVPDVGFALPLPTGPAGTTELAGEWPPGVPSGFSVYVQAWVEDEAGPAGFAASNALSGSTP